jgi:7-cyano-7-deazaguanine synthase
MDAVVLLSGGLDSATVVAMAKAAGYRVNALTIAYGQRHAVEIESAKALANAMGVARHHVQTLDLRGFGGSALTANIDVPKGRDTHAMAADIPVTYVPARNTIFLSLALAWAEVLGASDIFLGVNALDYSGYPDCRPEFIRAFAEMARLATKQAVETGAGITIHTPLIAMTKAQIIQAGLALKVNYELTTSCYDPDPTGLACGACDSCLLRKRGFVEAGVPDPTRYGAL